jgi:radical SAM protein with 4Fe4S-binding SPASM domain
MSLGMRLGRRALSSAAPAALSWVDGFFCRAREHIFAREEDGVVILPPNQVYKANSTGIAIIRHLLGGGKVGEIPGLDEGERTAQVSDFLSDVRDLYVGEAGRRTLEQVPYSFSYTTLPILGEIAVTYRCNNSCLFCYAGCGTGGCHRAAGGPSGGSAGATPQAPEMTLPEIERVIRVFREDAQIPFFSFTGGEPLLREDLEKMIRSARRAGLQVNLITNATLADGARARSLHRAGLRTAQVSLESTEEAEHDLLTASPGSFRATLAGIAALRRAGISVQTNTTITSLNAARAPLMPAFLGSLGVSRFAMNLYIPSRAAGQRAADLFFPYSKAGAVIEAVRKAARAEGAGGAANMTFYWYSPIPHCTYNPVARGLGNKSCAAMDGLLSVSPAGDVLPCSSYPLPMGNLLRESFRDIWFSDRARHFKTKQYAPPECAGCEGFTACQAACPLYWEYAGTEEIRACR